MAPEIREGGPGDPACDVYTAGALLYFAVTGLEPPLDTRTIRRPTELRPTCPRVLDRMILRALQPAGEDRYLTAGEMLEDLASDVGTFETRGADRDPGSTDAGGRPGALGKAVAPRARRRLRAAGTSRLGRIRTRLSRARPSPRAGSGSQGVAPFAHAGSGSGRAIPPRSAARRAAQPSEHREHFRYRRAVGSAVVHDGADQWAEPGAARRTGGSAAARQDAPPPARGAQRSRSRTWDRDWCTATSNPRTC